MAKDPDYRLKEVNDPKNQKHFRVDFELPEDEMGIALIQTGALGKMRNAEFYLDDRHPAGCFRSKDRPSHAMQVYPVIQGIEDLYRETIAEAHRMEKILEAIALVSGKKGKEGSEQ